MCCYQNRFPVGGGRPPPGGVACDVSRVWSMVMRPARCGIFVPPMTMVMVSHCDPKAGMVGWVGTQGVDS